MFETFEQLKYKLEDVEKQLSSTLNIEQPIRSELIRLDKENKLIETELVAKWHELYAIYMDWIRWERLNENRFVQ